MATNCGSICARQAPPPHSEASTAATSGDHSKYKLHDMRGRLASIHLISRRTVRQIRTGRGNFRWMNGYTALRTQSNSLRTMASDVKCPTKTESCREERKPHFSVYRRACQSFHILATFGDKTPCSKESPSKSKVSEASSHSCVSKPTSCVAFKMAVATSRTSSGEVPSTARLST